MTDPPEDGLQEPVSPPESGSLHAGTTPAFDSLNEQAAAFSPIASQASQSTPPAFSYAPPSSSEPTLFYSYAQPPVRRFVRIPNFGHLLLLSLLLIIAFSITSVVMVAVMHFHLFGWVLSRKTATDIGFNLAFQGLIYIFTFGLSLIVFPLIWKEGYFRGLQWHGEVARTRFRLLVGTASACFGLAILDQFVMPGPPNAPIEKMISSPGAAWIMFAFGVTAAPFFEEMFFRGFMLPAFCTACDWAAEKEIGRLPRPLDATGHPQWSMPAMIIGSIATSIPFALLHVAQQGHSLGPFVLIILVSMILCAVRLKTKSLAASTLVHACYNFLLFCIELIFTGGFRHFDKM